MESGILEISFSLYSHGHYHVLLFTSNRNRVGAFIATRLDSSTIRITLRRRSGAFKHTCLANQISSDLMKSRNANGDVPGLVDEQGEYMTVNLSLIVGHIRKMGKRRFVR